MARVATKCNLKQTHTHKKKHQQPPITRPFSSFRFVSPSGDRCRQSACHWAIKLSHGKTQNKAMEPSKKRQETNKQNQNTRQAGEFFF
jgi:hypothetical protein